MDWGGGGLSFQKTGCFLLGIGLAVAVETTPLSTLGFKRTSSYIASQQRQMVVH
jgi:hypothetical protein